MAWDKIEDHLFEKYCVEGEDAEFCRLMEEHDAEIREKAITEFAERCKELVKQGELYDYVRWGNWNNSACKWFDRVAEQLKGE